MSYTSSSSYFVLSKEDPKWNADETSGEFFERCVVEMARISGGHGGNQTKDMDSTMNAEDTPESACETIMQFKTYGMYGPGYTDIRQIIIIVAYSILILVGTVTNLSVCWVVVRNSQARTARNLFVINLAISDISVCLITMPLTMLRLIHLPTWNYGSNLCKMIGVLEGTNLLVSSGTASAIAGDRLCLVTRKNARHNDTKVSTIALVLLFVWVVSILSMLPTFFYNGTYNFYLPKTELVLYHICAEFWPSPGSRFAFTAFLMFVQYVIPITVILITHMKIIAIVKLRMSRVHNMRKNSCASTMIAPRCQEVDLESSPESSHKIRISLPSVKHMFRKSSRQQQRQGTNGINQLKSTQNLPTMRRNKKTTQILLIIAFCFGLSWLPYHCFMIVLEVNRMLDSSLFELSTQLENDIFTLVHLIAMSTTISNPILYGWLNTNLKHLFRAMIPYVKERLSVALGNSNNQANSQGAAGIENDIRQQDNSELDRFLPDQESAIRVFNAAHDSDDQIVEEGLAMDESIMYERADVREPLTTIDVVSGSSQQTVADVSQGSPCPKIIVSTEDED